MKKNGRKMIVKKDKKNVILEEVVDFDLSQTLECGQCFRYEKISQNEDGCEYIIVAFNKMLRIRQSNNRLIFFDTSIDEYENLWKDYFDLDNDYDLIKKSILKTNKKLGMAIKDMSGVRILKQEFFETLISFIISQNKQIPHIMKIVEMISKKYGSVCGEYKKKKYYSFPSADVLKNVSEQDFRECKMGFRAPYIVDAISKVISGDIDYDYLSKSSIDEAIEVLMTIKGVGSKIANCVALFSLHKTEAFPVDVWIKRIMIELYFDGEDTDKRVIEEFAKEKFGNLCGYAQQYLFYYARKNGINKKKNVKK